MCTTYASSVRLYCLFHVVSDAPTLSFPGPRCDASSACGPMCPCARLLLCRNARLHVCPSTRPAVQSETGGAIHEQSDSYPGSSRLRGCYPPRSGNHERRGFTDVPESGEIPSRTSGGGDGSSAVHAVSATGLTQPSFPVPFPLLPSLSFPPGPSTPLGPSPLPLPTGGGLGLFFGIWHGPRTRTGSARSALASDPLER